jgi:alpha-tubulin suppressor-like RCC1 family protein
VYTKVVAGQGYTVALKSDGTIRGFGHYEHGLMGTGYYRSWIPILIGRDNNWKDISGGQVHTVAIKTDGSLWARGTNYDSNHSIIINIKPAQ